MMNEFGGAALGRRWGGDDMPFDYPKYDADGKLVLTRMADRHPDMLMDIHLQKLPKGRVYVFESPTHEAVVQLMTGEVEFAWDGRKQVASRRDLFSELPWLLHISRAGKMTVTALADSEILVQATTNPRDFPARLYRPEDTRVGVSCEGKWENTAVRDIRTTIDYSNAPYSNLVIGEVIHRQGRWSSYIPHHHDQPEVYYYRFDKPQGFGACFIGDDVYKIKDNSYSAITGGLDHPQVTAPGYRLYFCWMIRHLDGNPWTDRIDADEHKWLLDAKF